VSREFPSSEELSVNVLTDMGPSSPTIMTTVNKTFLTDKNRFATAITITAIAKSPQNVSTGVISTSTASTVSMTRSSLLDSNKDSTTTTLAPALNDTITTTEMATSDNRSTTGAVISSTSMAVETTTEKVITSTASVQMLNIEVSSNTPVINETDTSDEDFTTTETISFTISEENMFSNDSSDSFELGDRSGFGETEHVTETPIINITDNIMHVETSSTVAVGESENVEEEIMTTTVSFTSDVPTTERSDLIAGDSDNEETTVSPEEKVSNSSEINGMSQEIPTTENSSNFVETVSVSDPAPVPTTTVESTTTVETVTLPTSSSVSLEPQSTIPTNNDVQVNASMEPETTISTNDEISTTFESESTISDSNANDSDAISTTKESQINPVFTELSANERMLIAQRRSLIRALKNLRMRFNAINSTTTTTTTTARPMSKFIRRKFSSAFRTNINRVRVSETEKADQQSNVRTVVVQRRRIPSNNSPAAIEFMARMQRFREQLEKDEIDRINESIDENIVVSRAELNSIESGDSDEMTANNQAAHSEINQADNEENSIIEDIIMNELETQDSNLSENVETTDSPEDQVTDSNKTIDMSSLKMPSINSTEIIVPIGENNSISNNENTNVIKYEETTESIIKETNSTIEGFKLSENVNLSAAKEPNVSEFENQTEETKSLYAKVTNKNVEYTTMIMPVQDEDEDLLTATTEKSIEINSSSSESTMSFDSESTDSTTELPENVEENTTVLSTTNGVNMEGDDLSTSAQTQKLLSTANSAIDPLNPETMTFVAGLPRKVRKVVKLVRVNKATGQIKRLSRKVIKVRDF